MSLDINGIRLTAALDTISQNLFHANSYAEAAELGKDDGADESAEWLIRLAFTQLLVVAEAAALPLLRADIASALQEASVSILEMRTDPGGDRYSVAVSTARRFVRALEETLAMDVNHTITKDVESILREATYFINDPAVFPAPPANEDEVHRRVEAVLRTIFSDISHKPRLPKAIKNFEPDTALPSVRTLIEFKYIATKAQLSTIADEILADTRGYESPDWTSVIFAI